ncbi:MAG: hypothetical protein WCG16_14315 [Methylococcales bacterium]
MIAAIFGLIEYLGHLKEVRIEKTLVFYEQFLKDPIFSSRTNILKKWELLDVKFAQLPKANNNQEVITTNLKKCKEIVVTALNNDALFTTDTDIMFGFFDSLQVCIENNICDKKSAHELMQDAAKIFFGNNCSYVAYVRFHKNIKNFGIKTEALADHSCNVETYKEFV